MWLLIMHLQFSIAQCPALVVGGRHTLEDPGSLSDGWSLGFDLLEPGSLMSAWLKT